MKRGEWTLARQKGRWGTGCVENGESGNRGKMRITQREEKRRALTEPSSRSHVPNDSRTRTETRTEGKMCLVRLGCRRGPGPSHLAGSRNWERKRRWKLGTEHSWKMCKKAKRPGVLSDAEPDTGPAGHLPSLCPGWCHHSAGRPLVSADSV